MLCFLVDESWVEDSDDIIEYFKKEKIQYQCFSETQLMNMTSDTFLYSIYFTSTNIVQFHLQKMNKSHFVPNTYDDSYQDHFHREIKVMTLREYKDTYTNIKRFIKPYENNKLFRGCVIESIDELEFDVNENLNIFVYTSDPVLFSTEVRLLIGNGKLYAKDFPSDRTGSLIVIIIIIIIILFFYRKYHFYSLVP